MTLILLLCVTSMLGYGAHGGVVFNQGPDRAKATPKCGTLINSDLPVKLPLFLHRGKPWYPDGIYIDIRDNLKLACSGSKNVIDVLKNNTATATASCDGSTNFKVGSKKFSIEDLTCKNIITGDLVTSSVKCADNQGTWSNIGFKIGAQFINLFRVCYNMATASPIYSEHVIPGPSMTFRQKESYRPSFKSVGTPAHVSPREAYKQAYQLKQFERLLGSSEASKYIIEDEQSYLARGHLAPHADFAMATWQFATYFYVNVCPQWQSVNAGNWLKVETLARKIAENRDENLVILTGGHDILRLPNARGEMTDIFLEGESMEVPKWLWKVIYSNSTLEAIAFVSLNNPFVNHVSNSELLCEDVCKQYKWKNQGFDDYKKGYTICCDVNELKRVVRTIPKINVQAVMRYQ